ncbi:penicillin-binding protein activator [Thioalkalivibrio thiocyanodenitrificans]|uniref:penicillin-binding protein activator n=1 Tax=Thioalkalivibrio thiocyanodenitrificans TaxID=243063 RepID=UPI000477BBFA|nr:penicillin-binding protein activator [Thioalkalivibrio thiocyanodenitrificans]
MTHPLPLARLLTALLISLTLAACAPAPRPTEPPVDPAEAVALEQAGETLEAARLYLRLAAGTREPQRTELTLRGLELLLAQAPEAGDEESAESALAYLATADLAPQDRVRTRLANARLALWRERPEDALAALPAEVPGVPAALGRRVEETRADAYAALEDWGRMVETHIRLEGWQSDQAGIDANREELWDRMLALDRATLMRLETEARDPVSAGWLALARAARGTAPVTEALERALEAWAARYPDHPAAPAQVRLLREQWAALGRYPDHIAVLLPMSGRLSVVSSAVYEGLTAAYYGLPADARPTLRLYDTGEQPEAAWTLYQQAVDDGADLVIGPLDRQAVTLFAGAESLPVPVLALNHSVQDTAPEHFYQYGLNPEDEARQAAEHAAIEGHLFALVLAPRNDLGERLGRSFAERFEDLGGMVLSTEFYAPQASDFAGPITRGVGLEASSARHRQLQNVVRRSLEFEPRRRQDLDLVFMVGSPREARLLAPQLRFHRAGDLPVLSTSHAYDGTRNPQADQDLDGVVLADIPWVLDVEVGDAPGREALSPVLSPASRQLPRLVAMGHDALRLVPLLNHLHERPGERFAGLTGSLHLDESGRIHRQLHWARFQRGELRPLMAVAPPDRPVPDAVPAVLREPPSP